MEKSEMDVLEEQLPDNIKDLRKKIFNYKPPEVDRYGDGFLAQAYFVAKGSSTGSYSAIARELGLDMMSFNYYMETYPDFVAAVNMGRIDGSKDRITNLQNALLSRAYGLEVEEKKTEESGIIDEDGNFKTVHRKQTTVKKQVPPDTAAILEILRKIDPSWNPKSTLEVNYNQTMDVTQDVNINVDLRELSPDAIKEIMNSVKQPNNPTINKTPSGESVYFLGEQGDIKAKKRAETRKKKAEVVDVSEVPKKKSVKKRTMTKEKLEEITNKPEGSDAKIS